HQQSSRSLRRTGRHRFEFYGCSYPCNANRFCFQLRDLDAFYVYLLNAETRLIGTSSG
ncbi:MAG: hypothetical protein ACI9VS_001989, partial [Candidatus Binatia bacterium]